MVLSHSIHSFKFLKMRMLTFSFLKTCKLKSLCYHVSRQMRSVHTLAEADSVKVLGDPSLIEVSPSWPSDEEPELQTAALQSMCVLPNFVSEQEEAALLAELEPYLKRMRYEFDHWDNAIQGYRETERVQWKPENEAVIRRVKETAFREGEPLPHAHVLDLAPGGHIKPHVDAVRFCGDVIAGLCLLSSAVMRLEHCDKKHLAFDALLQRRALYIMRGVSRYKFTHAVLGSEVSVWRGRRVPRARRLAVICRAQPSPGKEN